jgi:transcription-repair coupling factor (superfamily II helicase)
MLHVKFSAVNADQATLADSKIDPAMLMKLVSRNAKRGAQFTPQGTLRWPLPSAKAEDVLSETRALLDALDSPRTN